ncbi:MAG: M15 family metallopeptidase [Actinobacteria bacterium]|nr:M15 family metallopeptidase [Actinomycetota bacterium]
MRPGARGLLLAAAVAGVLVGALLSLPTTPPPAVEAASSTPSPTQPPAADASSSTLSPTPFDDPTPHTPAATPPAAAPPTQTPDVPARTLLVWTAGGLPPGLPAAVEALAGVTAVSVIQGGEGRLIRSARADGSAVDAPSAGWFIPLDVLAVHPDAAEAFISGPDRAVIAALRPGDALLGRTSAALRRVGVGGRLEFDRGAVTVAGIVDDLSVAGAEAVVHADDAHRLGVETRRALLVAYRGGREDVQRRIAALDTLQHRPVRFRSPAETTWLRHGDAVLPQALIKAAFGEFAVRGRGGRSLEVAPEWEREAITRESVPVLGTVRCHHRVIPALAAALGELERANLAHLVDPADFAGCYSPRRIAAGAPPSRHAWGIAVDLNVDGNPRGSFSTQDPRLVAVMRDAGFGWGGSWLVPDPAHYEVTDPARLGLR